MRVRILLTASLALNLLLGALWLGGRSSEDTPPPAPPNQVGQSSASPYSTNVVVRRQFFSWAEVESDDYTRYIGNLRSIGCPESTIRDIIVADVNQLFAKRRSIEALPTTRQWWQSEADPRLISAARAQLEALDQERRALLEGLLGPNWQESASNATVTAITVPLDGPILEPLPDETKELIQEISGQAQARFQRILAIDPEYPDPAAVAELERWLSSELAGLLSPAQREEFMFRYAPSSQALRSRLANIPGFDATPMEIRTLYRNVGSIDLQLMALQGDDPSVQADRQALLQQWQYSFQNALGPARYREYVQMTDVAYQQAIADAERVGATEAADLFYVARQIGAEEVAGINQNSNLTDLQKELATKQIELEQLQVVAESLGESTPPEPPPLPLRSYEFRKGDTIAQVSMRTGVPVALILRANPNLRPEQIPPGTQIIIPDATAPFP